MKKTKSIRMAMVAVCLAVIFSACDTVQNLFSNKLNIKMIVEDANGIHKNSPVFLVNGVEQNQIGRISKIKSTNSGGAIVYLSIEKEFRSAIRGDTVFTVCRPLLTPMPPNILVDGIHTFRTEAPLLDSGAIVHETSYTKYQLLLAASAMKDIYDVIIRKSLQFMSELDHYLQSNSFDQILDQMDQIAQDIASFTLQQKERFEKEILPQLEESIDEAIKKYMEEGQEENNKDRLEQEMQKIREKLQA
ncbi:MAG: hypothetical protein JW925_14350 [Syntrophaceae bacterium]|nr:hypothetical protein [Syntrophaceae bacterium]